MTHCILSLKATNSPFYLISDVFEHDKDPQRPIYYSRLSAFMAHIRYMHVY